MVIVGHMSSKSAFGAKNTGQKFLTPKNFWWCRNICHDSCPGVIFGAGRGGAAPSFSGAGRGRVENFRGRGAPGQPFPPGPGRGGAGRASLIDIYIIYVNCQFYKTHFMSICYIFIWYFTLYHFLINFGTNTYRCPSHKDHLFDFLPRACTRILSPNSILRSMRHSKFFAIFSWKLKQETGGSPAIVKIFHCNVSI